MQRRVCPHEGRIILSRDKRSRQVRQCLAAAMGPLTLLSFATLAAAVLCAAADTVAAVAAASITAAASAAAGLCGRVYWCEGAT